MKASTRDYFAHNNEMTEIYALTDGVSDDAFDAALEEAREEGNLSRANVVRKVASHSPASVDPEPEPATQCRQARADLIQQLAGEGYSSRQMPSRVGVTEESVRKIARPIWTRAALRRWSRRTASAP